MKITTFVSWLTPVLVLSLVCSFTLTATAQNYYPSEIGNTWTLLSADGTEQRTYEILEAEGIESEGLFLLKISTHVIGTETSRHRRLLRECCRGGPSPPSEPARTKGHSVSQRQLSIRPPLFFPQHCLSGGSGTL